MCKLLLAQAFSFYYTNFLTLFCPCHWSGTTGTSPLWSLSIVWTGQTGQLDTAPLSLQAMKQGREGQLCCWWWQSCELPVREVQHCGHGLVHQSLSGVTPEMDIVGFSFDAWHTLWMSPTSKKIDIADVPVHSGWQALSEFTYPKDKMGKSRYKKTSDPSREGMWSDRNRLRVGPREIGTVLSESCFAIYEMENTGVLVWPYLKLA